MKKIIILMIFLVVFLLNSNVVFSAKLSKCEIIDNELKDVLNRIISKKTSMSDFLDFFELSHDFLICHLSFEESTEIETEILEKKTSSSTPFLTRYTINETYVPYIDAIKNVNLGDHNLSAVYVIALINALNIENEHWINESGDEMTGTLKMADSGGGFSEAILLNASGQISTIRGFGDDLLITGTNSLRTINLNPFITNIYDIGTPLLKWRNLWLMGNISSTGNYTTTGRVCDSEGCIGEGVFGDIFVNESGDTITGDLNITGDLVVDDSIEFSNLNMSIETSPDYTEGYFNFDGDDDDVDMGNPIGLRLTTALSLAFWFKPNQTNVLGSQGTWSGFVDKGAGSSSSGGWGVLGGLTTPGMFRFSLDPTTAGGGNCHFYSTTTTWTAGTWYHIVATFDGTTNANSINIYVDGNLDTTDTSCTVGTQGGPSANFRFGADSSGGRSANASMDEVMVFNDDLSQAEVTEIYNLGRNFGIYNHTDIISHWSGFDGTAKDLKGLHHGTLNDGATVINETTTGLFEFKRDSNYARIKTADYLYGSPYYTGDAKEDLKTMTYDSLGTDNWGTVKKSSFPLGWLVKRGNQEHLSLIGAVQWLLRLGQQHDEEIEALKLEVEELKKQVNP